MLLSLAELCVADRDLCGDFLGRSGLGGDSTLEWSVCDGCAGDMRLSDGCRELRPLCEDEATTISSAVSDGVLNLVKKLKMDRFCFAPCRAGGIALNNMSCRSLASIEVTSSRAEVRVEINQLGERASACEAHSCDGDPLIFHLHKQLP